MNTKTIIDGLTQLPDYPTDYCIAEMTRKLRRAEKAIAEAETAYEEALKELAFELIDARDGWTVDEISATDLRNSKILMEVVRAHGKNTTEAKTKP